VARVAGVEFDSPVEVGERLLAAVGHRQIFSHVTYYPGRIARNI
jgi:hypothetical protein